MAGYDFQSTKCINKLSWIWLRSLWWAAHFSIPLWWSSLLSSVTPFSCFLLLALQFSPELPKQCSGILAVPEHTRLLLLISAEHPVPPISPGPSVLTPADSSNMMSALKRTKNAKTVMPCKTYPCGRKTVFWASCRTDVSSLLTYRRFSWSFPSTLSLHVFIVTSLIGCLIQSQHLPSVTFSILLKDFLVHLSRAVAITMIYLFKALLIGF